MRDFADVRDLRNLLSVARKLRGLAAETLAAADRELYLTAAVALEARAHRLATTLPGDRLDAGHADSHQPIDLLV